MEQVPISEASLELKAFWGIIALAFVLIGIVISWSYNKLTKAVTNGKKKAKAVSKSKIKNELFPNLKFNNKREFCFVEHPNGTQVVLADKANHIVYPYHTYGIKAFKDVDISQATNGIDLTGSVCSNLVYLKYKASYRQQKKSFTEFLKKIT